LVFWQTIMTSAEIFKHWLAAINSHDVIPLTRLMAEEHEFVDSLGNRVHGARSMEAGWRGYFAMCPEYWIRSDHVITADDTSLAAGEGGGTIDGASWHTPAAWMAVVRDGRVMEWQAFADNKPVYEILARRTLSR
jgi:ketosteroid isomerase-like protein